MKPRYVLASYGLISTIALCGLMSCQSTKSLPIPSTDPNRTFTKQELLADLNYLLTTIREVHPSLDSFMTKEEFQQAEKELQQELPAQGTSLDLFRLCAPFVSSLKDGHTTLRLPQDGFYSERSQKPIYFPFNISLRDGDFGKVIRASNTANLSNGDVILSINGNPLPQLYQDWLSWLSDESLVLRRERIEQQISVFLWISKIKSPYVIEFRSKETGSIQSVEQNATRGAIAINSPTITTSGEIFRYQNLSKDIGYLDLFSFNKRLDYLPVFKQEMANLFRKLNSDKMSGLIIDLRNNNGGYPEFGLTVLGYLTPKPAKTFDRMIIKVSQQARDYFTEQIPWYARMIPLSFIFPQRDFIANKSTIDDFFKVPVGSNLVLVNAPVAIHPDGERFAGKTCILIGPRTFSAAMMVADAVKSGHLSYLVGEETGGRVNAYSQTINLSLPNTGLKGNIAMSYFVGAEGDASLRSGVLPDLVVSTSTEDKIQGKDPVLEAAREYVGK